MNLQDQDVAISIGVPFAPLKLQCPKFFSPGYWHFMQIDLNDRTAKTSPRDRSSTSSLRLPELYAVSNPLLRKIQRFPFRDKVVHISYQASTHLSSTAKCGSSMQNPPVVENWIRSALLHQKENKPPGLVRPT